MFEFSTRQFVFSHGRAPKGRGSWAFEVEGFGKEPIFTPSMTYSDAKVWIKAWVRSRLPEDYIGTVWIEVLP